MEKNIEALVKACKNLNIDFKVIDEESSFVSVNMNGVEKYFIQCITPLNSVIHEKLARDKELSYIVLKDVINMPKTLGYIDPNIKKKFQNLITANSVEELSEHIASDFPGFNNGLVIKPTSGKKGINLSFVKTENEIIKALKKIFNKRSQHYDFGVIVQELVNLRKEYRVITIDGKIELVYSKNLNSRVFEKNDHKPNKLVNDEELIKSIQNFLNPVFKKIDIRFCGFDVGIDDRNEMYLIELNSQPGFELFLKHNPFDKLVFLYEKVLKLM